MSTRHDVYSMRGGGGRTAELALTLHAPANVWSGLGIIAHHPFPQDQNNSSPLVPGHELTDELPDRRIQ